MEENERKPIFTNTYGPNEETFKAIYRYARKPVRVVYFVLLVCITARVAATVVSWILRTIRFGKPFPTETALLLLAGFALVVFAVVWEVTGAKRYAGRQMRRIEETYGTRDPRVHASFYDNEVEFHNDATNSTNNLTYDKFAKCAETKDLFLIITREKQFLTYPKDCFEGVDVPGFRAFMDEKCPNAKRKWKKAD